MAIIFVILCIVIVISTIVSYKEKQRKDIAHPITRGGCGCDLKVGDQVVCFNTPRNITGILTIESIKYHYNDPTYLQRNRVKVKETFNYVSSDHFFHPKCLLNIQLRQFSKL